MKDELKRILRSVANMAGFEPPFSEKGKAFACVGDAYLRYRVSSALLRDGMNMGQMSAEMARVLCRDHHARIVEDLGLISIVSMPVGFYLGEQSINNHSVSTVLESIVGQIATANPVAEALDLIVAHVLERGASDSYIDTSVVDSVVSVPVTVPVNSVTKINNWCQRSGHEKPVIEWSTSDQGHVAKVILGLHEVVACGRNKSEAKGRAFDKLVVLVMPESAPNVVGQEDVAVDEVVAVIGEVEELLVDGASDGALNEIHEDFSSTDVGDNAETAPGTIIELLKGSEKMVIAPVSDGTLVNNSGVIVEAHEPCHDMNSLERIVNHKLLGLLKKANCTTEVDLNTEGDEQVMTNFESRSVLPMPDLIRIQKPLSGRTSTEALKPLPCEPVSDSRARTES